MKKGIIAVVIVLVLAGVVAAVLMTRNNKDAKKDQTTTGQSTNTQSNSESTGTMPDSAANSGSNASSSTQEVSIKSFAFTPKNITVARGTTVTWTNSDSTEHTVTGDSSGGPQSGSLGMGDTYQFRFDTAGTFHYHCKFHSDMTGTVTVTGS